MADFDILHAIYQMPLRAKVSRKYKHTAVGKPDNVGSLEPNPKAILDVH